MNQTITQRRELRRAAHQWRRRPRPSNTIPQAAHPRIAGALATIADRIARIGQQAEQLVENGYFIGTGLLLAIGFLVARSQGVMP